MSVLLEAFEAFHDGLDGPCPACGAVWVPSSGTVIECHSMTHSVDCAYLAWEAAEQAAWEAY